MPARLDMVPEDVPKVSRHQIRLGVQLLKRGAVSPSSKIQERPVKEHWFHLQREREGDDAFDAIDAYVDARIAGAKAAKKKTKKFGKGKTDTSKLPIAPRMAEDTKSTWRGSVGGLREVASDDHVYLMAHGMLGGPKIGNWYEPTDQYTPEQIAERLEEAELPKRHRILKLFACWGATSVTSLDPSVSKEDDRPFAERLAAAMVARGYLDIEVYGFAGTLSTPREAKTGRSTGSQRVQLAECLGDYTYLREPGIKAAKENGLEKVAARSDLEIFYDMPMNFASIYGLHDVGDLQAVGKLSGWDYRGAYLTDMQGEPWVLVIPYPPEPLARERGLIK
ncbi:MAG: hypothetical protein R3B09_20505 [Nannocystaceae bacterium]